MYQAHTEWVQQVLNAHEILVGRYDQMLRKVMDSLQAISSTVSQLNHQISLLTSQPPAPPSATPSTVSNHTATNSAQPHSPQPGELLFHPQNIIQVT